MQPAAQVVLVAAKDSVALCSLKRDVCGPKYHEGKTPGDKQEPVSRAVQPCSVLTVVTIHPARHVLAARDTSRSSTRCITPPRSPPPPLPSPPGCDYIAVQSYDGQLYFFEAEALAFTRYLPHFLVPGPLA